MPAPTTILVGRIGKVFWLRVEGRGTFQDAVQVKRAFQSVIAAGNRDLVRLQDQLSDLLGTRTEREILLAIRVLQVLFHDLDQMDASALVPIAEDDLDEDLGESDVQSCDAAE